MPKHKTMKEWLSILACGNADTSNRLKPVVVGKSHKPRTRTDLMPKLSIRVPRQSFRLGSYIAIVHWTMFCVISHVLVSGCTRGPGNT